MFKCIVHFVIAALCRALCCACAHAVPACVGVLCMHLYARTVPPHSLACAGLAPACAPLAHRRADRASPFLCPFLCAVIKDFCKLVGVDNKQCQGVIRLAKKNGEWLGFLA